MTHWRLHDPFRTSPTQEFNLTAPGVIKAPVDNIADAQVKASASQFITQLTPSLSSENYQKLREENAALLAQNKQLKAELHRKSEEWRRIKSILSLRKSIRDRLSPTKEEWANRDSETIPIQNIDAPYEPENHEYVIVDEVKEPSTKAAKIDAELNPAHQFGCPCCTKFYSAVGDGEKENVLSHSRHKYRQMGPATPPGFWNVNFTQE